MNAGRPKTVTNIKNAKDWIRETTVVLFYKKFMSKVTILSNGCWKWGGSLKKKGYGYFSLWPCRKTISAHRISYMWFIGDIANGLTLDHLCRNRYCVNPSHLEPVTNKENILRGEGLAAENIRKTHCAKGHEFTLENTYTRPGTKHRSCRECRRAWSLKWYYSKNDADMGMFI